MANKTAFYMTIKPKESLNRRRIEGAFLNLLRAKEITTVSEQVISETRIIQRKGKYGGPRCKDVLPALATRLWLHSPDVHYTQF